MKNIIPGHVWKNNKTSIFTPIDEVLSSKKGITKEEKNIDNNIKKAEERISMITFENMKLYDLEFAEISLSDIDAVIDDVAYRLGYSVINGKLRRPGKITGGIEINPESFRDMFIDEICNKKNEALLGYAIESGYLIRGSFAVKSDL